MIGQLSVDGMGFGSGDGVGKSEGEVVEGTAEEWEVGFGSVGI
jgi:hypothetical protein